MVLVKRKPRLYDLDGNDVTEERKHLLTNNGNTEYEIEVEEDEMLEGDEIITSKVTTKSDDHENWIYIVFFCQMEL